MEKKGKNSRNHRACALALSLIVAFWVVLVYIRIVLPGDVWSHRKFTISTPPSDKVKNTTDPCTGKYIFVYELDPKFNEEMIDDCARATNVWKSKCKEVSVNLGMGPPLEGMSSSSSGWYGTNPYALDAIFFNRMKRYECLTDNPSEATAFFVPFYGGFDLARYIWGYNTSMRDAASMELFEWLTRRPEWGLMGGKDHFMVSGRMASDFRRGTDKDSDWGNKLLTLFENMTILLVESSSWGSNDFAVPWPTYFHPVKDSDVFEWQARVRNSDRKWMFSFVGAARLGDPNSIRSQIIDQCRNSHKCELLECDRSENSECYSPQSVMGTFRSSSFCVQPPGDTLTRRSIFDSLLAGCIPVLFHPGSAYTQYTWHLPEDYESYSVFIPEADFRRGNVSIEATLAKISHERVEAMRENVIQLIPRIVYADPRGELETVRDAFDVAVDAVIEKVASSRNGKDKRWKYVVGDQGTKKKGGRDWDRFFLGK